VTKKQMLHAIAQLDYEGKVVSAGDAESKN
jgi:hypothetical protein